MARHGYTTRLEWLKRADLAQDENGRLARDDMVEWLRSQPDQAELLRSSYLDLPMRTAAARFAASEEWQETLRRVGRRSGQALDLGAGNGIASYALAQNGWQVVAAEPSPGAVTGVKAAADLARGASLPISLLRAVGEALPFADECFDLVYSRQVLHHVRDLSRLCSEVCRVLRPCGVYLACAEHVVSSERQLRRFLRRHPLHWLTGDENAFRLGVYKRGFESGGLQVSTILRPFDSAINFAPYTRASLRLALADRFARVPGGRVFAKLVLSERLYDRFLGCLSRVDRRPGRPYTFLVRKPR